MLFLDDSIDEERESFSKSSSSTLECCLVFCLIFCQVHLSVGYKSVAYKEKACNIVTDVTNKIFK